MSQSTLDIGVVAKRSGLTVSTLRYYEGKGLIVSSGRNGLRRIFCVSVLERLALITLGRNVGFSLEEIATMISTDGSHIDKTQLAMKADQITQTIKQLTAMRDGLNHAINCPEKSHIECPKFRQTLRIAVKKQRKKVAKL